MASPKAGQRSDQSPSSDETVGDHASDRTDNARLQEGEQEKPTEDEEKGQKDGPPQPVGFFHKALNKVRLDVFKLWARTSQYNNSARSSDKKDADPVQR